MICLRDENFLIQTETNQNKTKDRRGLPPPPPHPPKKQQKDRKAKQQQPQQQLLFLKSILIVFHCNY